MIAAILLLFTLLLSDFFDTVGTVTAIGHESGLADKDGNVDNIQKILLVDSVAAAAGGAAGISSNTSYIESAAGVGEGARTGLASVVTGLAFLLTTFLSTSSSNYSLRGCNTSTDHCWIPDDGSNQEH